MKKTTKKILLVMLSMAVMLSIFGVSRIVMGEDTGKVPINDTGSSVDEIGRVPLTDSTTTTAPTTTTAEFTGLPVKFYLNGDANEDNKVTMDDAIYMLMHLYFPNDYPVSSDHSLDVNKDGKVNVDDAIRIMMGVEFPSEYPLNPEPKTVDPDED